MKILLSGIGGHMGAEVLRLAEQGYKDAEITTGVDLNGFSGAIPCARSFDGASAEADLIIDFSHHSATKALLDFAVSNHLPLVLATTGQTAEELEMIKRAAGAIPLFFSANYSVGVALLIELAKKAASVMKDADIEIVETHHNRKLDAPSGTALAIANGIQSVRPELHTNVGRSGQCRREKDEIGISSVRMGNIVGEHEVILCTENQSITLKHEAYSRALFAEGALTAAEFLLGKPAGLYDMNSMLADR